MQNFNQFPPTYRSGKKAPTPAASPAASAAFYAQSPAAPARAGFNSAYQANGLQQVAPNAEPAPKHAGTLNVSTPTAAVRGEYKQGLHGGELEAAADATASKLASIKDFSTTCNIFARPLTQRLLQEAPELFDRYPEASYKKLKLALAAHEKINTDNIMCAAGSSTLIWATLAALAPKSVLFIGPGFSEYTKACDAMNIQWQVVTPAVEDDFAYTEHGIRGIRQSNAELTVLASPNMVSGTSYDNIQHIFAEIKSPRILIDLSLREFLYGDTLYDTHNWRSFSTLVSQGVNLLCLHSFSDFFCAPGVPLAYLTADSHIIRWLEKMQPGGSIPALNAHMGTVFLEHLREYRASLPALTHERYALDMALQRLSVFNSDMIFSGPGFFCCGLQAEALQPLRLGQPPLNAHSLQVHMLHHKMLIRNCDNIPGMPPGFVRIQTRSCKENDILLDALSKAYV